MRRSFKTLLVLCIFIISLIIPTVAADLDNFTIVNQTAMFVEQNYKYGVTSVQLKNRALEYMLDTGDTNIDNVLKAMFEGLDDYSVYFTEEEYKEFIGTVNASLSGIGVTVTAGKSGVTVVEVHPFSPAEKAGIKKFDTLVSANGNSLAGADLSKATEYMKGEAGTVVKIGVKRYGTEEVLYFDIVRGNVEISPVTWKKIDDETAYLSISILSTNADRFVKDALAEIDKLGIKKIILDLRDNPGGSIDSTVEICGLFMPEGPVGYIDYKDPGRLETYYSKNKNPRYKLAVLINGNTASGAEFLAGGIQDTKVGVLFGETSFGKGSAQSLKELVNGGAIKLTVAKYYTAGKQDVLNNKIVPDFEVKNAYRQINEEGFAPLDFETEFKVGSKGEGVLAIEQRLVILGYMDEADENFTEETMDAVRKFKAYNGMSSDPVVEFDFIAFINNIEYGKNYEEVDRQFEVAYNYLKGLE